MSRAADGVPSTDGVSVSTEKFTGRFKARLQRFAPNVQGRDWAVGDIHGCFMKLQRSLYGSASMPSGTLIPALTTRLTVAPG